MGGYKMKKTILAITILFSVAASAQVKPKADSVLTMNTPFISLNDLFRKADMYKDSVIINGQYFTPRQHESFMVLFNAIVTQLINDTKKKN